MRRNAAFTLVELLVTVTVLAIALAIGVPSFRNIVQSNRLATQTNELVTALNLARSEAAKRGRDVVIASRDDDADGSLDGNWSNGWQVGVDDDRDGFADASDVLVRDAGALDSDFTLDLDSNDDYFGFDAAGNLQTPQCFLLCMSGVVPCRKLNLAQTGHVVVTEDNSCP